MPFKGDMRLGGARRNDSTLNGMTEGPDYPALGTVLSVLSNVEYPIGNGGASVDISEDPASPDIRPSQRANFNVVADGVGGQFTDYANPSSISFYPAQTVIVVMVGNPTSYLTFGGNDYENGYYTVRKVHDGYGGWSYSSVATYTTTAVFLETGVPVNVQFDGSEYQVGNATRTYSHNGLGGYSYTDMNTVYFANGTVVGSGSGGYYVSIGSNSYQVGGYTFNVISDGVGYCYNEGTGSYYDAHGTFIVQDGGYNYYSDGMGSYYSEQVPSYPGAGTPTGNSSSGTNYISINGNSYENGSYNSVEYNDGNGGTYWDTSYSYQPYGYTFFSESYTDEFGNNYNTNYYSDGNGSYYTGS